MTCILTCIYASTGRITILDYTLPVYSEAIVAVFINCAGVNLLCIAYQKANPAIVGLFMYIGVAYHYLVDKILFEQELGTMQIIGLSMSLTFTVLVALYRVRKDGSDQEEKDDEFKRVT